MWAAVCGEERLRNGISKQTAAKETSRRQNSWLFSIQHHKGYNLCGKQGIWTRAIPYRMQNAAFRKMFICTIIKSYGNKMGMLRMDI